MAALLRKSYMKNRLVSPSIFASDFYSLKTGLLAMENAGVDMIHFDVMDNHFVPNISFGKKVIEDVICKTKLLANVHLMIDLDHRGLDDFLSLNIFNITIHSEATEKELKHYLELIKKSGKTAGISIKPSTPISSVKPYLEMIDLLLVMSVEPGYSGQVFMDSTLMRLNEARDMIADRDIIIQVDGGVNRDNYKEILKVGANCLVIGSAFFRDRNPKEWVKLIKEYKE